MVHPSELLRTNSNEGRSFSAPRDAYQLDCGITNLPILNRWCNLEKLASPKVFLVFLSLVGFLQGVTLTYFRETAKYWGKHYNISPDNIDWLIYTNEFFVGVFALVVSYYGNKIHRISWIGALTIFQAIASAILLVPEIYKKNDKNMTYKIEYHLCGKDLTKEKEEGELNWIALVVLATYQIFYAMVSISFISHGITYIDDNAPGKSSPGHIGIALACRELGKHAGLYLSWIPTYTSTTSMIFASPVWLCISAVVFLSGVFIAMFPKSMPSTMVKSLSASLIDLASGYEPPPKLQIVDGFFKTLFRLLRNKILMVNTFSIVFIESGLINFNIFEKYFNQSQFQVSLLFDTSYNQFISNILKQPLVALTLIAAGFIVAKTKPHLKSLVKWNITAIILVIIFFGSTAFLRCEGNTTTDIVDTSCKCNFDQFQPVCIKTRTYYSPCNAGCKETNNDSTQFTNCRKTSGETADAGPCKDTKCDIFFALSQVNRVITTALLASTLVTNLIINMRCILSRDKATALGIESTFSALITYLPVKAIYGAVAENYCIFSKGSKGVCRLYSRDFATFLSACTIGFMVVSLILSIVVLILLKRSPINEGDDDEDAVDNPTELYHYQRPEIRRVSEPSEHDSRNYSAHSVSASLLEMEDVGDDHDSVGSTPHLDDHKLKVNKRMLESNL